MFTIDERERLRDRLVSTARDDARISAAALIGSAALDREDRWSDIDLALRVADDADRTAVIADWTERMYREHAAAHHFDVPRGETLYRVFLLHDTLQVDLSFWPADEFRAVGPSFRLLFGDALKPTTAPAPTIAGLVGMGWLYALHARSSLARRRVWQAEYMISGLRDQVLALACLRHDVPAIQGRGIDSLSPRVTATVEPAIVRSLDIPELKRAFAAATEALLDETEQVDPGLANRLAAPLGQLAS